MLSGILCDEPTDPGLRVMRFSNRATNRSNTSSADLSAGDRSLSLLRSTFTELMVESTSISSIFNDPHHNVLAYRHYRMGFQGGFFGLESNLERNGITRNLRDQLLSNNSAAGLTRPSMA